MKDRFVAVPASLDHHHWPGHLQMCPSLPVSQKVLGSLCPPVARAVVQPWERTEWAVFLMLWAVFLSGIHFHFDADPTHQSLGFPTLLGGRRTFGGRGMPSASVNLQLSLVNPFPLFNTVSKTPFYFQTRAMLIQALCWREQPRVTLSPSHCPNSPCLVPGPICPYVTV